MTSAGEKSFRNVQKLAAVHHLRRFYDGRGAAQPPLPVQSACDTRASREAATR